MAELKPENKQFLELVLDGAATVILMYLVWTLGFNQPKIGGLHEMIAVLGTAALGWLAWKSLRRSTALK